MISFFRIGFFPTVYPVSLADVKTWLVIEHDRHDSLLESLIEAAIVAVEADTGLDLSATAVDGLLAVAIKQLVGVYYENREAASPVDLKEIPFGLRTILLKYRKVTA